jgi:hypothetical protein
MKHLRSACFSLLLGLSALAPTAHAEASAVASEATQESTFSFKFPGGSIDDFAKFLASPEASRNGFFNLIVHAEGHAQHIPAFEVRGVNRYGLANAISMLFHEQHGWRADPAGDINSPSSILVIRRHEVTRLPQTRPESIADLLKPKGVFEFDDVVSALQLAWTQDVGEPGPEPTLKFHEKSAILLINSRQHDYELASAVLVNMRSSQKAIQATAAKP